MRNAKQFHSDAVLSCAKALAGLFQETNPEHVGEVMHVFGILQVMIMGSLREVSDIDPEFKEILRDVIAHLESADQTLSSPSWLEEWTEFSA